MHLIFSVLFLSAVFGAKLPTNFKRCSSKDTTCLKNAIQDALPNLKGGIPELGVPVLDPISTSQLNIAAGQNVVKLDQKYKNANLYGLSNSKIENVVLDFDKGKMKIDFTAPLVEMNATYDFEGQLLTFPIRSSGKSMINLIDLVAYFQVDLELVNKGDERYIKGNHPHLHIDVRNCQFAFHDRDTHKSKIWDNINEVLNENWKSIFEEIIPNYAAIYAVYLMELMNKLFETIPISEIFTDIK